MKIIHLADTHLGFRQYAGKLDPDRGLNQRECDVYDAWQRAVNIAIERNPGLVIHAGDLFDSSRPTPFAITQALDGFRRFREAGIPVVVIAGNHSTARFRSAHGSVFQILERFGIDAIWDGPQTIRINGVAVHACPHEPDAESLMADVAGFELDPTADANVLVLHAGLEAVKNSYGEVNEVEINPELLARTEFDYIALGHLHRFQTPQINAIYPGSLERLDFNDLAGDKAILEIDLGAGAGSDGFVERLAITTRQMLDLGVACGDLSAADVLAAIEQAAVGQPLDNAIVRLRLENIGRDAYQALDFSALGDLLAPCLHHVLSVGREGLRSHLSEEGADLTFTSWARGRVPAALDEEAVIGLAKRYLDEAAAEEAEAEAEDVKLVSLSLRQWRTFEVCDLEFPDGLIGVRGQNGAGKTTIAEAIGWALFGKLRPGAKVSGLRRQGAAAGTSSSVELVFRLGSTLYRVHRVVGGAAKLWIGDSDDPETTQTRSTNARIALELDLTWDVFQRTVFARQKDVAALDPTGSADARRRHVERLLGLERYRLAAEKARGDARSIRDELTGRRAQVPDLKEIATQLQLAEEQAAASDPEVEKAQTRCDAATKLHDSLVAAVDAEMERATRHAELIGARDAQKEVADRADVEVVQLREASALRLQKRERHKQVAEEASRYPEALGTLELWDDLEIASTELAEAAAALEAVGYESDVNQGDSTALGTLVTEDEGLAAKAEALRLEAESVGRRLAALRAVESAGNVGERRKAAKDAQRDYAATRQRQGVIQHELEADRAHVAAVTEGGSETPCPVCLRPYGDEYEDILATYNTRIHERTEEARILADREGELQVAADTAEEALRNAELAAAQLEATDGEAKSTEGATKLAAIEEELASILLRREQIEKELPPLREKVAAHTRAREDWRVQGGVRAERDARSQQLREKLGVEAHTPEMHARARELAEELKSVSAEFDRLAHELEATKDVDDRLAAEENRASQARALEAEAAATLDELAFDAANLETLRGKRDNARQDYQDATTALADARAAAQAGSENVRGLRAQLEQAQTAHDEIQSRAVELERHETAARLLTEFRAHQSQRAWPHLEQGASAILSAATDGRYADVRLSEDYRVVVVDRGEEHELTRFSGGEQDITNLCLRIAIAEWVAREREAVINFMVLDEVFGSQDDERRQLLLSELRALGNRFHQLLVITHVGEIADLCDHHIEVTLEETGRSMAAFRE